MVVLAYLSVDTDLYHRVITNCSVELEGVREVFGFVYSKADVNIEIFCTEWLALFYVKF